MSAQPAMRSCECGSMASVTPTDSPWEFDVRCVVCGRESLLSWFHGKPAPVFEPIRQQELFDAELDA